MISNVTAPYGRQIVHVHRSATRRFRTSAVAALLVSALFAHSASVRRAAAARPAIAGETKRGTEGHRADRTERGVRRVLSGAVRHLGLLAGAAAISLSPHQGAEAAEYNIVPGTDCRLAVNAGGVQDVFKVTKPMNWHALVDHLTAAGVETTVAELWRGNAAIAGKELVPGDEVNVTGATRILSVVVPKLDPAKDHLVTNLGDHTITFIPKGTCSSARPGSVYVNSISAGATGHETDLSPQARDGVPKPSSVKWALKDREWVVPRSIVDYWAAKGTPISGQGVQPLPGGRLRVEFASPEHAIGDTKFVQTDGTTIHVGDRDRMGGLTGLGGDHMPWLLKPGQAGFDPKIHDWVAFARMAEPGFGCIRVTQEGANELWQRVHPGTREYRVYEPQKVLFTGDADGRRVLAEVHSPHSSPRYQAFTPDSLPEIAAAAVGPATPLTAQLRNQLRALAQAQTGLVTSISTDPTQ